MAILIQRFRLRFVWLLTGHPRFKPLYHADIVSPDVMEQAAFLASAGYYVAAAMLSRLAVEGRVKRLAMLSKQWKTYTKKPLVETMAHKLQLHGRITKGTKDKIAFFYERASGVAHGDQVSAERCIEVLTSATAIVAILDDAITTYVRSSCPPMVCGTVKGGAA